MKALRSKSYPERVQVYNVFDSSSSFLKNIKRIAELEYSPNNGILFFDSTKISSLIDSHDLDDILNVRLQTLGVMEHSFPVSMAGKTYHWKLYDVGGAVSDFIVPLMD